MLYLRNLRKWVFITVIFILTVLIFTGCTTSQNNNNDPYTKYNHFVFTMNENLDTHIIKPIAVFYNKVIPQPINQGVNNFFINLNMVPTIFNDLLQVKIYQALSDSWRLGVNSTIGLLGTVDIASRINLATNSENFGLTLAAWGWTDSNYFILPLLGPSTVRGAIGLPIDWVTSPIYYCPTVWYYSLYALELINTRVQLLSYNDLFDQLTLDRYLLLKTTYLQHLNYLINRNKDLKNPYSAAETYQSRHNNTNNYLVSPSNF